MKLSLIPILFALTFLLVPPMSSYGATTDTLVQTPFTIIHQDVTKQYELSAPPIMNENGIFVMVTAQENPDGSYLLRSTDDGVTWTSPIDMSASFNSSGYKRLFATNDNGDLVVCGVNQESNDNVQCSISTDNGDTWNLQSISTGSIGALENPAWAYDDDNLIMTYVAQDSFFEIGVMVSNDFGVTWEDAIILIADTEEIFDEFELGQVVVHGMNMYFSITYYDDESDQEYVISFSKSNDDGATWSTPLQVNSEAPDLDFVGVNLDENGGKIIFTYTTGSGHIQSRSSDGGITFVETILDDFTECDSPFKMSNNGEDIIYHCVSYASGSNGIAVLTSDDFGETYTGFSYMNGTSFTQWNNLPLNLFVGDNDYHIFYDDRIEDETEATYISYSQNRGLNYNTDIIPNENGTRLPQGIWDGTFAFGNIFGWIDITTDTIPRDTIELFLGQLANSGSTPADIIAPVISLVGGATEPVTVIEDSDFDDFDYVVCLDEIDGDISIMMDVDGMVNTGNRGTYDVTYTCTDEASNQDIETVTYIVKKKAGGNGGSSGSSSSGTSGGTFQQNDIPKLSDIPVLSFSDSPSQQGTPTTNEGQSISDLFANLFDNRITEGITTPTQSQGSSPLGGSSDTSQRPNPITDFLQNLFANFFS